jgi:hypothetical protein
MSDPRYEFSEGEWLDLEAPDADRPIVDVTRLADLYERRDETPDLLDRLRGRAFTPGVHYATQASAWMREAADEIDRLRGLAFAALDEDEAEGVMEAALGRLGADRSFSGEEVWSIIHALNEADVVLCRALSGRGEDL